MSRIPPLLLSSSKATLQGVLARMRVLEDILNGEVDFGYPDDGTGTQQLLNVRGAWASATITDPNQLGAGAGAPVTFTHNLGVPVQTAGGNSLPNVRPVIWLFTHGDKTGVSAAPAAAANQAHSSFYFRVGDPVTSNAIAYRVHSGLAVTATEPLLLEIFFHHAVR